MSTELVYYLTPIVISAVVFTYTLYIHLLLLNQRRQLKRELQRNEQVYHFRLKLAAFLKEVSELDGTYEILNSLPSYQDMLKSDLALTIENWIPLEHQHLFNPENPKP